MVFIFLCLTYLLSVIPPKSFHVTTNGNFSPFFVTAHIHTTPSFSMDLLMDAQVASMSGLL